MFFRTKGSPPVMRIFRTPFLMNAVHRRSSSSSVRRSDLRQERHVLRHAIDAAEVAAIGDRNPQIGDVPPERIDHGSAGWLERVCGEMLKGHRRRPDWD